MVSSALDSDSFSALSVSVFVLKSYNLFSALSFSYRVQGPGVKMGKKNNDELQYGIDDVPPWYTTILLAFQVWKDDVIKRKHFPRYWPFVRGIHRSPVNSPHKGQWRGALIFSWVNNREAGDFKPHRAHYDVTVMEAADESISHWGRVTHVGVSKLNIGSDNGLSHGRRQAIIWTNAGILLIGPLGINFSQTLPENYTFAFKKMHLKMSSGKWRPFFSASM